MLTVNRLSPEGSVTAVNKFLEVPARPSGRGRLEGASGTYFFSHFFLLLIKEKERSEEEDGLRPGAFRAPPGIVCDSSFLFTYESLMPGAEGQEK